MGRTVHGGTVNPLALNTVVRNEAHRIVGLLEHAATFCDELVVVDQHSDDGTVDLALEFGAKVVLDRNYGFCEPSRPLALAMTRADWIVSLDADEVLSDLAITVLLNLSDEYGAAKLPVLHLVDGEPITEKLDAKIRYYHRDAVIFGDTLHSRIEVKPDVAVYAPQTPGWIIETKSRDEWEADHKRYAELSA